MSNEIDTRADTGASINGNAPDVRLEEIVEAFAKLRQQAEPGSSLGGIKARVKFALEAAIKDAHLEHVFGITESTRSEG